VVTRNRLENNQRALKREAEEEWSAHRQWLPSEAFVSKKSPADTTGLEEGIVAYVPILRENMFQLWMRAPDSGRKYHLLWPKYHGRRETGMS
jgi:hypothetical protein